MNKKIKPLNIKNMKSLHLTLLFMLITLMSTAGQDYIFRKSNWNDSKSKIIASESIKLTEQKSQGFEMLYGETTLMGLDVLVIYSLADNMLVRCAYVITEEHSNRNDYIDDYKTLKELLVQKYGRPKKEKQVWKDDLYQDDPSDYGFAVSLGHLVYYALWHLDGGETIGTNLTGENYEILHTITYESPNYGEILDNIRSKTVLEEL
jgi:hypothetical protein